MKQANKKREDNLTEQKVPGWFNGTYEEYLEDLNDEEQLSEAERWLLEHQDDDFWVNGENGMEILVDNAPDYVYAYAKRYNDEQDEFNCSAMLKYLIKNATKHNKAGNNIAFYRVKNGLTQKEFANLVGMHIHAVGYAENHHCSPKLACDAANVLGENVFNILGSDVLKVLPKTEEDKMIIIETILSL